MMIIKLISKLTKIQKLTQNPPKSKKPIKSIKYAPNQCLSELSPIMNFYADSKTDFEIFKYPKSNSKRPLKSKKA